MLARFLAILIAFGSGLPGEVISFDGALGSTATANLTLPFPTRATVSILTNKTKQTQVQIARYGSGPCAAAGSGDNRDMAAVDVVDAIPLAKDTQGVYRVGATRASGKGAFGRSPGGVVAAWIPRPAPVPPEESVKWLAGENLDNAIVPPDLTSSACKTSRTLAAKVIP